MLGLKKITTFEEWREEEERQLLAEQNIKSEAVNDKVMLTDTQKKVLEKWRNRQTEKLTRNDYQVIETIRNNCRYILENCEEAKKLYLELTK